jgi:hypothetical protein
VEFFAGVVSFLYRDDCTFDFALLLQGRASNSLCVV